jgi:transposase
MANVLKNEIKQQVLALGRLGWSLRRIQQATHVRRETISAYLKAEGIAVWPPGGWARQAAAKAAIQVTTGSSAAFGASTLESHGDDDSQPAKPAMEVTTGSARAQTRVIVSDEIKNLSSKGKAKTAKPAIQVTTGSDEERSSAARKSSPPKAIVRSACESFREEIELGLSRGRNAMAIWQDLVSEHGFGGGYQSVKRFAHKLRGSQSPKTSGIILTSPGEEAQVDYGSGPLVRAPETGKYRRTRLFVMTLGYSRKSIRLLTFRSSSRIWAELHERAFRRLGGSTRIVVLDNLREGVLVPDIYDPTLNPVYRDMLTHYGAVAMPCRIKDPDRKGKVESGVGHAQRTPLKGKRFESLEEAQAYLDRWETNCADTRIHGTTKRQVAAMFAEEKPILIPLPLEPFRYYQHGRRVVHLDGCVEVEAAYYGLPPGWIGREVNVQWNELYVRILDPKTGQLLREHVRQKRGWYRIQSQDHPKHRPLAVSQLLWRASRAGPQIGALCNLIYQHEGEVGVRRILGVLALAKKFGTAAVEDACAAALEMGVHEYRFVRRYLERGPQLTLRQVDPLIRELVHYRDLIQYRTQEQEE